MSFGYFRLPAICPALRGPRNNRSSECEIRKRSWRFGVHFAIPIARNPLLYTLHFPLYTRKIAPISDFSCIYAKKVVSLRAKCVFLQNFMNTTNYNKLFSFIWNIATDVLVYAFEKGEYKKIILPMMVLRRIDVLLEPTKKKTLEMKEALNVAHINNQ